MNGVRDRPGLGSVQAPGLYKQKTTYYFATVNAVRDADSKIFISVRQTNLPECDIFNSLALLLCRLDQEGPKQGHCGNISNQVPTK